MRLMLFLLCPFTAITGCAIQNEPLSEENYAVKVHGFIHIGPESVTFTECGASSSRWISGLPKSEDGWKEVSEHLARQPVCNLSNIPCQHQSALVTGYGYISEPGTYGHAGQYNTEIKFIELDLLSDDAACVNR